MTDPVLYSFRRCPYAMRARMTLLVAGIACEIREVKLRHKPPEILAASPKGTVPVLVLPDGKVIDESIDIMRWALGQNDPEDWIAGDDKDLVETNDGTFKHHLDRYKYADRHDADRIEHRAAGLIILESLEQRLSTHAYLCGDHRTLADIAIMPFVRQFAQTDRAWFDVQPLPRLLRWLSDLRASPLFEAAMVRREAWRAAEPTPLPPT